MRVCSAVALRIRNVAIGLGQFGLLKLVGNSGYSGSTLAAEAGSMQKIPAMPSGCLEKKLMHEMEECATKGGRRDRHRRSV